MSVTFHNKKLLLKEHSYQVYKYYCLPWFLNFLLSSFRFLIFNWWITTAHNREIHYAMLILFLYEMNTLIWVSIKTFEHYVSQLWLCGGGSVRKWSACSHILVNQKYLSHIYFLPQLPPYNSIHTGTCTSLCAPWVSEVRNAILFEHKWRYLHEHKVPGKNRCGES